MLVPTVEIGIVQHGHCLHIQRTNAAHQRLAEALLVALLLTLHLANDIVAIVDLALEPINLRRQFILQL